MNEELHIRYVERHAKMKELEAEVDAIKIELADMEKELIERFMNLQIDKISLKGGATIRLDRKIWPKVFDKDLAIWALKKAGLEALLARESYQVQALAGYLRELDKNDEPLPDQFKGIIEPNPVYKIIVTKY